jgi:hypothetical protein
VQLAETLKAGGAAAIAPLAAATGMGGIGKTQLAAEFAHRYSQYFAGGVFWLSFASADSVPAEIASCGGPGAINLPRFDDEARRSPASHSRSTPSGDHHRQPPERG